MIFKNNKYKIIQETKVYRIISRKCFCYKIANNKNEIIIPEENNTFRTLKSARIRIKELNKNINLSLNYRKFIKNYYDNKCAICESTRKLEIHHIDKNKYNNLLENLVLLCHRCHLDVHVLDRKISK